MNGATGGPTSVGTLPGERTYVAFADARPIVARYALGACGAAATAVPWIGVAGTTEPVIVQAAYTYLGVVGRGAKDGGALVLPYERKGITLAGQNPLGKPGRTLVAASNPAGIVPEIIAARRNRRGRTDVVLQSVKAWDDVIGGPPRPETPLAVLPRAPAAMASHYRSGQKSTLMILAYPGPRPGTVDLYAFDADVPL